MRPNPAFTMFAIFNFHENFRIAGLCSCLNLTAYLKSYMGNNYDINSSYIHK